MTKKSHVIIGIAVAGFILRHHLNTEVGVGELTSMVIGSYFPDIDVRWSMRRRKRRVRERSMLLDHRGITHHIAIPILLVALGLLYLRVSPYLLFFGLGVMLHDLLDMLSPLGIPYGYSYSQRIAFHLYSTGSWKEYAFVLLVLMVSVVGMLYLDSAVMYVSHTVKILSSTIL